MQGWERAIYTLSVRECCDIFRLLMLKSVEMECQMLADIGKSVPASEVCGMRRVGRRMKMGVNGEVTKWV